MTPNIRTEYLGGPKPSVPRRYKVKSTGDEGTALGPSKRQNDTHQQMNDGNRHLHVVPLLMDGTGEVRTFVADAIEATDQLT